MTPEQIDQIVARYTCTPAECETLTSLLADAYLAAKQQAYNRAQKAVGHLFSFTPWQPGDSDQRSAREWAAPMTASIVQTYETMLRNQVERIRKDEEAQEALGDVWQGIKDVAKKIGEWLTDFFGWKTEQIADSTWLEGENDGTEAWIDDVKASGEDYSALKVQILPESSSSDFCAQYAGGIYSYDDIGVVTPFFPAHIGCVHYVYVLPPDEQES
jgi:uncharacterized protein (UPF0297 family)